MTDQGLVQAVRSTTHGSYVALAASIGAGTLVVESALDFDETGGTLLLNGVLYPYTSANYDTDTITLTGTLSAAAALADRVDVSPQSTEKQALVVTAGSEDAVTVRVPHALVPLLPEGVRTDDEMESVQFEWVNGAFILTDVVGRTPVVDGTYIDETTLPPNPTDGLPPSSSPALTAQGNVGAIHLRWTPVANADPVKFNLHAYTTSGATLDAGNLVATTAGSSFTYVPAPLDYTATYYFRLVEFDDDGEAAPSTEVSAQLRQATNDDISAAYAYLGQVVVDQLVGGSLNADVLLAGAFRTADAGARRTIDSTGDVWYDSAGVPTIVLPVDGTAQFKGDAEVGNLTVTNGAAFRGAMNEVSRGGTWTLRDGTTAPQAAPSVVIGWDSVTLLTNYGYGLVWTGTDWANAYDGVTPTVFRWSTSGGAPTSSILLGNTNDPRPWGGLARIGTSWYTLGKKDSNNLNYLTKYSDAGVLQAQVQVGYETDSNTYGYAAAIGTDGTNILTARFDTPNERFVIETRNPTTLALTSTLNTGANSGFAGPVTGVAAGNFDFGSHRWIITTRPGAHYYVFDLDGDYVDTWPVPAVGIDGFAWDGTRFHGAKFDVGNSRIYKHTTLTWTSESSTWWVGATWRDTDATGGTHETDLSPMQSFTMKKRAQVQMTSATIPDSGGTDDPNAVSFYLGRGSTAPARTAMWRQILPDDGDNTLTAADFITFTGTNPPAANNFPGGTPGKMVSAAIDGSSNPLLKIDGSGDITRGPSTAQLLTQVLSANCATIANLTTTEVDITGATVTFTTLKPNARYMCTGSFYFGANTGSSAIGSGKLSVDGSVQTRFANFTGISTNTRANVAQTWNGTLASAGSHTLKLRGVMSAGTGFSINVDHTTITVFVFE